MHMRRLRGVLIMADNTKIEWADATANAINGCSVVSPGCTNCYAMRLAGTRMKHHPSRAGLTQQSKAGPVWTGEVRLNEKALLDPLAWKRPRRIFWNAHGDLFHESVPDSWIDRVLAVCALTPQHTHMILTKRSKRMREYLTGGGLINRKMAIWRAMYGEARTRFASEILDSWYGGPNAAQWPLPNVWLGVSVEDQTRRNRVLDLAQTPAAVRFVSGEPLLEGVSLIDIPLNDGPDELGIQWLFNALTGEQYFDCGDGFTHSGDGPEMLPLDWVIVGGESGPGARPMHPDWVISLRDQCAAAGVAFHFKQWGEWVSEEQSLPDAVLPGTSTYFWGQKDPSVYRVGKKAAGRLLDGVEHNGFPQ